jgi:antitoxin (DNA-binding transcriptional repressor) of toxin-antitoxin stability system
MKTMTLETPGLTLDRLLQEAAGGEMIVLTADGQPRFALVAMDEGDQEVFALRSNAEFMAYLTDCQEHARKGPRRSLEEVRRRFAE